MATKKRMSTASSSVELALMKAKKPTPLEAAVAAFDAIKAVSGYLNAREQRKAVQAGARRDVRVAKLEIKRLEKQIAGVLKHLDKSHRHRMEEREKTHQRVMVFLEMVAGYVVKFESLRTEDPEFAKSFMNLALKAMDLAAAEMQTPAAPQLRLSP